MGSWYQVSTTGQVPDQVPFKGGGHVPASPNVNTPMRKAHNQFMHTSLGMELVSLSHGNCFTLYEGNI